MTGKTDSLDKKRTKKKNKRSLSKHVLQALRDKEEVAAATQQQQQQSAKKKSKRKNIICKDPTEVAEYLRLWKDERKAWKFNKNTQSWLIRHMYDSEKVPKNSFTVLLEYLHGLGGDGKTRVRADATRRALRYKEYETRVATNKETDDDDDDAADVDDAKKDTETETAKGAGEDDETRWKRLDAHDKRKEYKRARKVLETLATTTEPKDES